MLMLACDKGGQTTPPQTPLGDQAEASQPTEEPTADPAAIAPSTPHAFSALDLLAMDRIGGHQVSPDGKHIVYVLRKTDLEGDRGVTDLYVVPTAGGEPKRLTRDAASDSGPQFSPDGASIYFVSTRTGSPQVWSIPAQGGDAKQVTDLPLPVSNVKLSPDGKHLAFTTEVFVDCPDLTCTADRLEKKVQHKPSGMLYERLFARHWDHWEDGRRSHLFVVPVAGGTPIDLSKGMDADVPSQPFGGAEEYTFSPDSKTVVFTAKDVGRSEAWSTNWDLFAVPLTGGEARNLTDDNEAWDTHPVFSPDGKTLVWAAMKTPGYEADRFGLMMRAWPEGEASEVAPQWDRSVADIAFTPDGTQVLVTAQNLGQRSLFALPLQGENAGQPRELVHDGTIAGPAVAGTDVVFARHELTYPTELFKVPLAGGEPIRITHVNDDKVKVAKMGEPEQFQFKGAGGDTVYGYVVKPVDFDPSKTYPIAFLIHGGPQGSFGNMFHYRWNAQTYAGAGYGVVMIDFHGSTGYGQKFTDAIGDDWGGKPLTDLQKGLAAALKQYPWLDGDRACALGASYGGFMINWIAGKWPDGFECLVNHDGVFDNRIMYYATEELWFPEREHKGPYWENPKAHEKHNPVAHVGKWKTPMLVIHGALDYRVPPTQGLAAFTALQRRGIESQLLMFPDENHWVLRPSNSLQWHDAVLAWLQRHLQ